MAIGGADESTSTETIVFDENLKNFPDKVSKAIGGFDPSTGIAIVCGGVTPSGQLRNVCFKMKADGNGKKLEAEENDWIQVVELLGLCF